MTGHRHQNGIAVRRGRATLKNFRSIAIGAALFALYGSAHAATVSPSDTLTVSLPTGIVTQSLYETASGHDVDTYGNPTNILKISTTSNAKLPLSISLATLREADDAGKTPAISDWLIYYTTSAIVNPKTHAVIVPSTQNWMLISDADAMTYNTATRCWQTSTPRPLLTLLAMLIGNSAPSVTETGFPQDVTALLGSPYTITVTSGVEAVPVPAAAWLFGSGLIGLIATRRKLK